MKKHLLSQAAALCLLASSAVLVSLPAAAQPAVPAATAPQTRGLEVNADSGLAPGSQLRFTLEATPGGVAVARLSGTDISVPLKEVSPGQYIGRHTVRRSDRIDPAAVIKVSLTASGRTVAANYTFPPSFMPAVASTVAPPRAAVVSQPPIATVLPLTVISHQNNAPVGQGVTTIRGRTAPFATVQVHVDAIAPAGRRVEAGVAQRLMAESVQADANGDFSFDFDPRYVRDNASSLPVPGTRYEVSISASRDNLTSESRLMLFQRG